MGMYTQLVLHVSLKDIPREDLDMLAWMVDGRGDRPPIPDHEFFDTPRWLMIPRGQSAYFEGTSTASLSTRWYEEDGEVEFSCICDVKNYSNEIEWFLAWIEQFLPRSEWRDLVGFVRYEENDFPDMLFSLNGKFVRVAPSTDGTDVVYKGLEHQ